MYLVTGGSGYFGEVLVHKLLQSGASVRVFDLRPPSFSHQNLDYFQGDIRQLSQIKEALKGIRIVHHNVAQVPLAKNAGLFWAVNHGGTLHLLKASLLAGVQKVVYTSSSAIYGVPTILPVSENTLPHPAEAYGKAKYAGELLCKDYIDQGLDISIIRPRTILGHGRLGSFQILFEWIYQNHNIPVLGQGDNVYQFVHAEDLADACIAAGHSKGPDSFNIGTDQYGTLYDAIQHLIIHAKSRSKIRRFPFTLATLGMKISSALRLSPLGPYHALMYGRSMYFDLTQAKEKLGFQPRYSNDAMFQESYDWYIQHRDALLTQKKQRSTHQSPVKEGILYCLKKII
jgi:nucleoside-diphosphate-sugar epimerase